MSVIGHALAAVMARAGLLRWLLAGLLAAAAALVGYHRHTLWNPELSALSPVAAADQALDFALRADLGAPDVRYLIVVTDTDQEAVLRAAEQVGAQLDRLVDAGALSGFDTPARFLPSLASQAERQKALPPPTELAARLQAATRDLPIRPERLRPFLADVEAARTARPLNRADLEATSPSLATDALLTQREGRWSALLPLKTVQRSAADSAIDPQQIRMALAAAAQGNALLVDLKGETNRLYAGYLAEAIYSVHGRLCCHGRIALVGASLARHA